MSRCLSDRTLLSIDDGEGTSVQRIHLKECGACAARYRQLEQDLEAIAKVLREEPPPQTLIHPSRPFTAHWLPRAAALAMALLLTWAGVTLWSRSGRPPVEGRTESESRSMLDELPSNPFLLTEALAVELATEGAGSYDLASTVLEAGRPCEWYDLPLTGMAESSIETMESAGNIPFAACVDIGRTSMKR